ncbi:MAG: DUF1963 domain-containing protein [Corynebacterium sp.]|nr:DUF1963 domain-containing protein [Corynebacterium sp.]
MFSSVEELRAAIRGTEDPELIEKTDEIIAASRPAVGFLPAGDGADAPLGASRVFGLPDVPQGFEWPTGHDGEPLFFLLQIDLGSLSELPLDTLSPEDPLRYLPQEGHMLLFGGSGRHEKCDAHAVKFLPPGQILVRTSMPEEVEEPDFIAIGGADALFKHGVLIEPEFGWDIPRWATEIYFEIVGEYGDLDDVYEELEMEGGSAFDLVRLGGCHSGIGCDPAEDAAEFLEATAPVSPAPTWHHLVTLDSDDGLGLCICDAGCFQVLVHSGDTKFAHTYASTESS